MALHTLSRSLVVPRPIEEVFAFFERPENLQAITPPHLHMDFLTPSPIPMHPGSVIDYRIRIHGLPLRWTTLITRYDPPRGFVDVQLRGPYAFWHHTHGFEPLPGGRTRMTDRVLYELPMGPLGELAHWLWVGRDLAAIFDFRQSFIEQKFGFSDDESPDAA